MRETKAQRIARFFHRMEQLGISYRDTVALRRIEMTLQRWGEQECGDSNDYCSWSIERDEATNKPYMVTHAHMGPAKARRRMIADRETGALKRLAKIMAQYPHLAAYHQGDPRGCSLYIYRKSDIEAHAVYGKRSIDSCYSSVGIAVCY